MRIRCSIGSTAVSFVVAPSSASRPAGWLKATSRFTDLCSPRRRSVAMLPAACRIAGGMELPPRRFARTPAQTSIAQRPITRRRPNLRPRPIAMEDTLVRARRGARQSNRKSGMGSHDSVQRRRGRARGAHPRRGSACGISAERHRGARRSKKARAASSAGKISSTRSSSRVTSRVAPKRATIVAVDTTSPPRRSRGQMTSPSPASAPRWTSASSSALGRAAGATARPMPPRPRPGAGGSTCRRPRRSSRSSRASRRGRGMPRRRSEYPSVEAGNSRRAAALASTTSHHRLRTNAGYGSCASSRREMAARNGALRPSVSSTSG